jgi:lipid-binding SYLF domain-containing protein
MWRRFTLAAGICLAVAVAATAAHSNREDDTARIQSATTVLHQIMATPDKAIPQDIMAGAQCIAVIPGEKKFALGFGGQYGKGLATCREGNTWTAPIFITLGGGSWGAQIGGQSSDVVMVMRDRDALRHLLSDKVKLGAQASAAAGPVGRDAEAATDASMHAKILTYSRSRGAFAGISLDGAVVQPDDSGNRAMYGDRQWEDVIGGKVAAPAAAQPLIRELDRYTAKG